MTGDMTDTIEATKPPRERIYEELKALIEGGAFDIRGPFPTEDQLRDRYGISRYALREALGQLEKEGYIERRRGAGSTVISRTSNNVFRHAIGSREDLLQYAHTTRLVPTGSSIVRTNGDLARLLGCDELREWQKLDAVRYQEDGALLGLVQVYIDITQVTIPADVDFAGEPVYVWIERNYGLTPTGLSQDIRARPLSPVEADALGEVTGSCALQIVRRYFDAGNSMYMISVNTYRSRDFVYNIRLRLQ
jgi:GntR family transcriptional regulator